MNSSENIIIEKASPEDTAELLRFLKAIGGETDNLTFGAEGLPVPPDEERELLASLETSETSAMFTAKNSGKRPFYRHDPRAPETQRNHRHLRTEIRMGAGNRHHAYGGGHRFCQKYRPCRDYFIRSKER